MLLTNIDKVNEVCNVIRLQVNNLTKMLFIQLSSLKKKLIKRFLSQ